MSLTVEGITVTVVGCRECPLASPISAGTPRRCLHPTVRETMHPMGEPIAYGMADTRPDWCPLLDAPIEVKLEAGDGV